jgi:hypothetical protein
MKIRMFEPLRPHTEVREQMTYSAGSELLVTFKKNHAEHPSQPTFDGDYGFDLYDFDDLVFQTAGRFSSLEDAKQAAMESVASLGDELPLTATS